MAINSEAMVKRLVRTHNTKGAVKLQVHGCPASWPHRQCRY